MLLLYRMAGLDYVGMVNSSFRPRCFSASQLFVSRNVLDITTQNVPDFSVNLREQLPPGRHPSLENRYECFAA